MPNPFKTTARRTLTPKQRAEFFAEREGECACCGRRIRPGEKWDVDHIVSLENQGSNDPENLQLLCEFCHGAKTPADRKQAATTRRKNTKNIVPRAHQKRSGFKGWRKFDGSIVWKS